MFRKIYKNYFAACFVLLQFVIVFPDYAMECDDLENNIHLVNEEKEYYDTYQIQKYVEDCYSKIVSICFDNLGQSKDNYLSSFDEYIYRLEEAKDLIKYKLAKNETLKLAYTKVYDKSTNMRKDKLLSMVAQFQCSVINYGMKKNWDKVEEITESFLAQISYLLNDNKKHIESYEFEIEEKLIFIKELALVLDKSKAIVSSLNNLQDKTIFNFKELIIAACVICICFYFYLDFSLSPYVRLNNQMMKPGSTNCICGSAVCRNQISTVAAYYDDTYASFSQVVLAYIEQVIQHLSQTPEPNAKLLLISCFAGLIVMRMLRPGFNESKIIAKLRNKLEQAIIKVKEEVDSVANFSKVKASLF